MKMDGNLLIDLKNGDEKAFETLFWEYGNNSYYTYDCIVGWVCWILNQ